MSIISKGCFGKKYKKIFACNSCMVKNSCYKELAKLEREKAKRQAERRKKKNGKQRK